MIGLARGVESIFSGRVLLLPLPLLPLFRRCWRSNQRHVL
jgi:hypothetical protein